MTTRSPIRIVAPADLLEPGDHPQRGRLAAAGRADEDHELALVDHQVERVDGARPVGIDLRHALELDRSHGLGIPRFSPGDCSRASLRDALLRPGQPGLDDQLLELVAVEAGEARDPNEDGRVAVEVRRGEVDPAGVGQHQLLHAEIGDAEHQNVVEPLARFRIDRVGAAAAMEAEDLAVHAILGPAVGQLLRRLRQREGELVEIGHRRHRPILLAS